MKHRSLRVILASLLVSASVLSLFACTTDGENPPPQETTAAETETAVPEVEAIDPADFGAADITYDCEDGSILSTYAAKSAADFAGVIAHYEKEGYTTYSNTDMGGNLAATYVKGDALAHIYYHPSNGELNVVLSDTAGGTLPPSTPAVTDGDYACTVMQMDDPDHVNGMCYVIQLKDGSYIVYDGGYDSQTIKLERYIVENYKGEGLPVVRAWVLTHSHNDHYPAFQKTVARFRRSEKFKVEHIIVSPLNDENYTLNSEESYFTGKFYEDAAEFDGAKVVFAHTGMKFTFCNLDMEILYAPESYYKTTSEIGNFNNTSIVSRLYDANYSALFTADVGIQGSDIIEALYGDYLKSDMCQISHHGVEDVPLSFYEYVQASILFYPCDKYLYDQTERHYEERKAMETWDCTKEILIQGLGRYSRTWGTTFAADAPLSIPDYKSDN